MSNQSPFTETDADKEENQSFEVRLAALEAQPSGLDFLDAIKISLAASVAVALLTFALVSSYSHFFGLGQSSKNSADVVFMDFEGLMDIALAQVREMDPSGQDSILRNPDEFQRQLGALLDEQRRAGRIVINKRALIDGPSEKDITPLIARQLGLSGAH